MSQNSSLLSYLQRNVSQIAEQWRDILSFEGKYQVSNFGRMRSLTRKVGKPSVVRTIRGKVLIPYFHSKGYLQVTLNKNGKGARTLIHRLVALAFIGEPPTAGHQIAHNDGDKTNNVVSNLRWATAKENEADKYRHGTALVGDRHPFRIHPELALKVSGEKQKYAKLTDEKVRYILSSTEANNVLATHFGVSPPLISRVRHRHVWKHVTALERIAYG